MKNFIYTRVSTDKQDQKSQMIGIDDYCQKNGISKTTNFNDTKSGAIAWRDRDLFNLVNLASNGDRIIVSELSRIGRSTVDVLEFLQYAAEKKLIVVAVKNSIIFDGSIQSKIFATVLSLASEIERDFIRLRTREGMANARAKGSIIGRPKGSKGVKKLDQKASEINRLLEAGVSKTAIASLMDVSRHTVIRYAKAWELTK